MWLLNFNEFKVKNRWELSAKYSFLFVFSEQLAQGLTWFAKDCIYLEKVYIYDS